MKIKEKNWRMRDKEIEERKKRRGKKKKEDNI